MAQISAEETAAFEKVCAAVAINNPAMPLHEVEQTAKALYDRVAYAALCVVCGSEPQEKLTARVLRIQTEASAQ